MFFETALQLIKANLEVKTGKHLTSPEKEILKAAWNNEPYNTVADSLYLSVGYAPLSVGTTLAAASTQPALKVDFIGLNSPLNTTAEVKAIQEALNKVATKAGFTPIKVDGVFGPNTEKAVKKFQEYKGLSSDGRVGKRTVTALGISWKSLPKLAQALGIPSNVA